jgi:pimeloyl-ACP methyl ester carboxylesterase
LESDQLFDAGHPLRIADQGCFFVGGKYLDTSDGRMISGQMFVQYQIPSELIHQHPVVMIHGGGQTGVNFLGTPDGRRGWADYFIANGYAVYVIDQPARGRSGFHSAAYGTAFLRSLRDVSGRFTSPAISGSWPQAALHSQWPGSGLPGDPVFDEFYASQVESMTDALLNERMMRSAGSALLARIGPSVLVTHSQAGPFGWTIADACPALVKAIIAVEPNGPPLQDIRFDAISNSFEDDGLVRPWGITRTPLCYDPMPAGSGEMVYVRQEKPDAPGLSRGWLQAEPARQLTNLKNIPVLMITAEASYHASYDHCTSAFLKQAGVEHVFVRLADAGIRGNGHMMMLEKNNLEIARYLHRWLEANES